MTRLESQPQKTALVDIVSLSCVGVSSVVFSEFDAARYHGYEFEFDHVLPVTDTAALSGYLSEDGGTTFIVGASDYGNFYRWFRATAVAGDLAAYVGAINIAANVGAAAGELGASGVMTLRRPDLALDTTGEVRTIWRQAAGLYETQHATFVRHLPGVINAVKFQFSVGAMQSGNIHVRGFLKHG